MKTKFSLLVILLISGLLSCSEKSSLLESIFENNTLEQQEIKYGTLTYNSFTYKTVTIGTQVWTVENLKTTKYNDGTPINLINDNTTWSTTTNGAYCANGSNESNVSIYGYLYNWYAVNTNKLAPAGWRVPTDNDWKRLTEFVGGSTNAGTKLKAKSGWLTNTGTDNYGFSALPGGYRYNDGTFVSPEFYGFWWCSTPDGSNFAWYRYMDHNISGVLSSYANYRGGFSVRLVRDL